jgi:membrane associated rhomboid family serine protease
MNHSETKGIAREFIAHCSILGTGVVLAWGVEIIDFFLGGNLNRFGILPRNGSGLLGILFAPLLHGDFAHLISNTVPFIALGWLVMVRRTSDFFVVTAIALLLGGLGTWLFGAPGYHIGASGLIFGYLGFLLLRGYFERSVFSILFSVFVGVVYGGLLWGVLPNQVGISWEGHLFGFLGGVAAAKILAKPLAKANKF